MRSVTKRRQAARWDTLIHISRMVQDREDGALPIAPLPVVSPDDNEDEKPFILLPDAVFLRLCGACLWRRLPASHSARIHAADGP